MNKIPRKILYGLCLVLIFLAALSLRAHALSKYDLWYDEIITEKYSQDYLNVIAFMKGVSPAEQFFYLLQNDYQPPFYYALVWSYSIFFKDEMALRWLSVVMGMLALGIFYVFSRYFLCKWEAMTALVIMAVSPFHIWYSQEARPYTSISFFSLLAVYCFVGAIRTNKRLWWITFLCAGMAAVFISYYSIVLLAIVGLVLLKRKNCHLFFRGAICFAFIGAVFIVLMPFLSHQIDYICRGAYWLNPPTLRELVFSPLVFTAGYLALPYQMVLGLILCWLLLVRGMFVFLREEREKFVFLFTCSYLPLLLIFLVSQLGMPIYLDRQLIVFAPFFYLFMARGVGRIKEKALKLGVIFFMGVFLTMALVNYYQGTIYCYNGKGRYFYQGVHPRKNYGPLMRRVLNELRPGDKIITADLQSAKIVGRVLMANFKTAERNVFVFSLQTLALFEKSSLGLDKLNIGKSACGGRDVCGRFYILGHPVVRKIEDGDFKQQRVWLIFSSWGNNNFFSENVGFVRNFLQDRFKEIMSADHDGFFIQLYERRENVYK